VDVVPAYGAFSSVPSLDTGWGKRSQHQVLYCATGVVHVQVGDAKLLLPPHRAAWIKADTDFCLTASEPIAVAFLYFGTSIEHLPSEPVCVFEPPPLAREMITYSIRWGADRDPEDEVANRFFLLFASLLPEWVQGESPFRLPVARSAELAAAMAFAMERLQEEPTIDDAARASGVSPRTLARRFQEEANTTWRKFLHDARMMRAMELLADRDRSVSDAANEVGFRSLGAFTRAFVGFTGERPREYHRRVTDTPED
jgi:AraC-like DNA-binding protein